MKDKIIIRLTAALWITTELAAVALLIIFRMTLPSQTPPVGLLEARGIVFAVLFVLLIIQGIGYAIAVLRQKYWRDLGKTLFWLGGVLFFGLLTIPVYWYRYILYKEYYN